MIIDNMMNLEMLFWASEQTGNSKYRDIAMAHADKTLKNHFRENMTSYHVVSYSVPSGKVESKGTFQGYSDSSAWARGQAWGVYGYTMCYRFTKNSAYLEAAHKIARFIMENRPSEMIIFLTGIMMHRIFRTPRVMLPPRLLPLPLCSNYADIQMIRI